jgi:hypothetical protein
VKSGTKSDICSDPHQSERNKKGKTYELVGVDLTALVGDPGLDHVGRDTSLLGKVCKK